MHRAVEGLRLDVLGQADRDGAGFGRIRQHTHGLGQRGEQLLRAVDAVPVTRDGTEAVVDARVVRARVFELLEHGRGAAVGEDVAREQQHRQAVDGRGRRAGDHVGRTGPDRGRAGQRAKALLGLRVGDGGVDHGLFVLRLKKRQGAAAVFFERLAETGDVAVAEDAADAVDQAVFDAVAADILGLQEADDRGRGGDADSFHTEGCQPWFLGSSNQVCSRVKVKPL